MHLATKKPISARLLLYCVSAALVAITVVSWRDETKVTSQRYHYDSKRANGVLPESADLLRASDETAWPELVDRLLETVSPQPHSSQEPLPFALARFVQSHDPSFLFDPAGVPIQTHSVLTADPSVWRDLATRLLDNPKLLRHVVLWLAGQQQSTGLHALAHFWGECLHNGVTPQLSSEDILAVQQAISDESALPDLDVLAQLARNRSLPEPFLARLHDQSKSQLLISLEIETRLLSTDDVELARGLISLAEPDVIWRTSLTTTGTPSARAAAVESLVEQYDDGFLANLLHHVTPATLEPAISIAAQWAPRHMSGDRIDTVSNLFQQNAFSGFRMVLFDVLLNNAEDQLAARNIAIQAGRPWRGSRNN